MYPKIYLALDNCFASKRWVRPKEWLQLAADCGIYCVEASADNEFDPLYSPPNTALDWMADVQIATAQTGVRVVNLYSGHGTYATLGLAHPDQRMRDHMHHHWIEPMIRSAAALDAGLGFFCHAFSQETLRDPQTYATAESDLFSRLEQLARFADAVGVSLCLEQMYSPHQIPWTVAGTVRLVQEVYRVAGAPLYLTLDTGHQVGQRNFVRPQHSQIQSAIEAAKQGNVLPDIWFGLADVATLARNQQPVDALQEYMNTHPYLFAEETDGDLYHWLRVLGAYSTIVHLQQTDGTASAHRPFRDKYNQTGIVKPDKVLKALCDSYEQAETAGFPPRSDTIYLTIEVFSGTAERPDQSLANIRESAAYWRQFVPEDGLTLDRLVR